MRAAVVARGADADSLVPLRNGGVTQGKTESAMHDTCNAANATAGLVIEVAHEARSKWLSPEEIAELDKIIDDRCLNRSVCLWGTEYERLSTK